MRRVLAAALLGAVVLGPGAAGAAPVTRDVQIALAIQGLSNLAVTFTGVTVDPSGSTVKVSAATLTGIGIVIPVSSTTSIAQISLNTFGFQAATFSLGGITNQIPSEVCTPSQPFPGQACNAGGGIGGVLGFTGTLNVTVVPTVVVIPVNLNAALIGQGGATPSAPFTFDAAGFSTGQAKVNLGTTVVTTNGGATPSFLTLVTPTYVSALNNVLPIIVFMTIPDITLTVPEPGALLLIGTGVAGLVVVFGGSRRRS